MCGRACRGPPAAFNNHVVEDQITMVGRAPRYFCCEKGLFLFVCWGGEAEAGRMDGVIIVGLLLDDSGSCSELLRARLFPILPIEESLFFHGTVRMFYAIETRMK